jgi:hypothetical protein
MASYLISKLHKVLFSRRLCFEVDHGENGGASGCGSVDGRASHRQQKTGL